MLDGLDNVVHLAAEYLLGDAESEAFGRLAGDVGGQGEGIPVHHYVDHDGPIGMGERCLQAIADVAGLGNADAPRAERGRDLAEVGVGEVRAGNSNDPPARAQEYCARGRAR